MRSERVFLILWTLAVLAATSAFILHLGLRVKSVELGYELGRAHARVERLREVKHVLELELASHKTPERGLRGAHVARHERAHARPHSVGGSQTRRRPAKAADCGGAVNARAKKPAPLPVPVNDEKRRRWVRLRMGILCGLLALGLGLVVSAGYDLMIGDGAAWRELAESQRQRRLHVAPKRGGVYDRNGSALAVSVEVPSVSLDAVELLRGVPSQQVPVVARDAANRIAAVLSIDAAQVERRILAKKRFAWLKRQISADEADKIRALSEDALGDKKIRGLVVEGEGRRYYPRRELAGPMLGFVAPDGEGKDGLEYALNDDFEGQRRAAQGPARSLRTVAVLRRHRGRPRLRRSQTFHLTIDQGIQYTAEHELQAAVRTFERFLRGRLGRGGEPQHRGNPGVGELPALQPERLHREPTGATPRSRRE